MTMTGEQPQATITGQNTNFCMKNSKQLQRRVICVVLIIVTACTCIFVFTYGRSKWTERRRLQFHTACKSAIRGSDWKKLEIVSRGWLNWTPNDGDALVNCAEAARQLGQPEKAADFLGQVSDSYHGALEALAFRGELLFADLNLPYAAEETWQRMLSINRLATLPRQRLIYFYTMTLQRPRMLELIREGIRLGCEPPEAYAYLLLANNLNFTDGFLVSSKWRNNYPDDQRLEVVQAIYAGRNKYDGDEEIFEKSDVAPGDQKLIDACLIKYPNDLEVIAYHAEKMIYEGGAGEMVTLLKNAPPEAADDSRFWRFRGWLLNNQNRLAEAANAFSKSLELSSANWPARYEFANVLRLQGKTEEAARQSDIAIVGKRIERQLFESPDARIISRDLVREMVEYMDSIGESEAASAFRRRTGLK